jgi:RND family efflux transporter MFP subunit
MSTVETESKRQSPGAKNAAPPTPREPAGVVPLLITLSVLTLAAGLGWIAWEIYVETPWTRDGTVRAYVVTMAPEVSGRIVELPIVDNQFVHKGDLLMVIEPTDYKIAVSRAEAAVVQTQISARNAEREAKRRQHLVVIDAVAVEQAQTFQSTAIASRAQYDQAVANLDQARVNLARTQIRSPVNGWVTNLLAQREDFASVGQKLISLVDADSFWVDAYFEETLLHSIHSGDRAKVRLMGYRHIVIGHVASIARAINVPNAQPNDQGVATTNPIFTWVRLAQRIPVRIHIDQVPGDVHLAAGMTATVEIENAPTLDSPGHPANDGRTHFPGTAGIHVK